MEVPQLSELQKRCDIAASAASFSVSNNRKCLNGTQHNSNSLSLPYTPRDPIKENYSLEDFQCKYCLRPFFSRRELSKHVELNHFTDMCFSCSICTKIYQSEIELSGHMQCTHGSIIDHTSRVCKFCERKFDYALLLSNHLTKYHIPTSECAVCKLKCNTIQALWDHMLRYHDMNPSKIQCNLCLEMADNPEVYHDHLIRAHSFPCMKCSVSTASKLELCVHLDTIHGKHPCLQCFEVFDTVEMYIDHGVTTHPAEKSYKPLYCPYCNGTFDKFSSVQEHLYSRTFYCSFCDCVTKTCHSFQLHLKTVHQTNMRYTSLSYREQSSHSPLDNLTTLALTASAQCNEPDKNSFSPFRLNPTIIFHPALTRQKAIKEEPPMQPSHKGKQIQRQSAAESDRSKDAASYIHNLITVNESLLSMKPSPLSTKYNIDMYQEEYKQGFIKARAQTWPMAEQGSVDEGDVIASTSEDMMSSNEDMDSIDVEGGGDDESEGKGEYEERKDSEEKRSESDTISSDESSQSSKARDKKDPNKSLRSLNINSKTMMMKQHRKRSSCSSIPSITEEQKEIVSAGCSTPKKEDFTCLVCSRKFVSQGVLSRHWGNPQQCYICSVTVCDVKILNEHMKTVHSETF